MSVSRLRTALLSLSAATALGSLVLLVAPAGATKAEAPVSGDARATAYAGNIKMGDCAGAGLAGSQIAVAFTVDESGTYVTITGVPEGTTLTGVVVKGGPAYNVYAGDIRTDLHAPLVSSGEPAQISHWFACGMTTSPTGTPTETPTGTPTETPTETPTGTPTETPTGTPTETPTGTPTGTPTETPTGTPTETPTGTPTETPTGTPTETPTGTAPGGTFSPPAPGPGELPEGPVGGLPMTGASSVVPVAGLGLALLLAGLALALSPAIRRRLG